ncbi:MAG: ribosome assembly RNA-binding protein YhbY [Clostridia bacterium]|nr:ribosome assembly RNA-binding protein YhbY [Clostridia bacterium]
MITSKQRAYLRSLAADIPCIMQIGKCGISENLIRTVSDALEARELVKLSVLDNSDETPRTAADALSEALGAEVVAVIGKKLVLYRESIKDKRIELP